MEKKKRLSILTIIVFLAFALSTGPVMAAQKVIKVGVVGPLTGQFAAAGQSQFTGAEMKAKEINAAGMPYRIELISEDDASKCDQTVNATVKLIGYSGRILPPIPDESCHFLRIFRNPETPLRPTS